MNPYSIIDTDGLADDDAGEPDTYIDALIDEVDAISAASKGLSVQDYLARRGLEDALVEWASGLGGHLMTEDMIERTVDRMTDNVDRRYLRGQISEQSYRVEMGSISDWADRQYRIRDRGEG